MRSMAARASARAAPDSPVLTIAPAARRDAFSTSAAERSLSCSITPSMSRRA
jgi:hypothetical protein